MTSDDEVNATVELQKLARRERLLKSIRAKPGWNFTLSAVLCLLPFGLAWWQVTRDNQDHVAPVIVLLLVAGQLSTRMALQRHFDRKIEAFLDLFEGMHPLCRREK